MAKKKRIYPRFDQEPESIRQVRQKESSLARRIIRYVVIIVLALMILGGGGGYYYISHNLTPVDAAQTQTVEIEIPSGASMRDIATILKEKNVIRDARLFNFYTKFKNVAGFRAGFYEVSPSMTPDQILETLALGGSDRSKDVAKILVREGDQLTDIAQEVAAATKYSADEFLAKVQDTDFLTQLAQKYPALLQDAVTAPDVKYVLEGYLFPATYDVDDNQTLQMIIDAMVAKTDEVLQRYYGRIQTSGYSVHQILTMASLVEKEGVTLDDRKKIASVFYNRMAANMMLQTDISVLYALGEHKEVVTLQDLEVDSPYNLYRHEGMGPGPFNSPSEEAIVAALEPAQTDYLYFVADIQTKQVYFARTYEEHLALQQQYVDKE